MSSHARSLRFSFYRWVFCQLRYQMRTQRRAHLLGIFIAATLLQSVAHGIMVACAGLLGQRLAGQQLAFIIEIVDARAPQFSLFFLCFLGFLAAIVKTGAGALSMYGQKSATFRVTNNLRQDFTGTLIRHGHSSRPAAETHATLAIRLREVERGVDDGVFASFRAISHIIPLLIILVLLSSTMALAVLLMLLPFALILGWLRRRVRAIYGRAVVLAEELHTAIDELIRHIDLWRTYGAGGQVQHAIVLAGAEAAHASARADATKVALSGGNEALAAGGLLVAIMLVEWSDVPQSHASLVAFAAVFFLLYRPLRDLGDSHTAVERGAQAHVALNHIRSELEARSWSVSFLHKQDHQATSRRPEWKLERLAVQSLSIALESLSTPAATFYAEPGEIIALIGPTGSGKTTFLKALLGLELRVQGTVRYGSRDLTGAGVGPVERPFAWVPQESAIISGTLESNIALGAHASSNLTRSTRAVLEEIGANALLTRAEGVYLHAGGHELSGGERQWIAIARALVSGLPVLLLDEPTSGLDPASQAHVLEALAALRGKRTVILVTHRSEPLAIADRVLQFGK